MGFAASDLVFDEGHAVEVSRVAVVASTDLFLTETLTLQLATGGLVTGALERDGVSRQLGPGWLLAGGATFRALDGSEGAAPFVLFSLTGGASGTRTQIDPPDAAAPLRGDYLAFDVRFGVTVGKTLGEIVTPYLAARAFGGPVAWTERDRTRLGTDRTHVQLAGGAALLLDPIDLFVEGAALGDRGVTGGVGVRY